MAEFTFTVAHIRDRYPNPVPDGPGRKKGEYCVGGALCLFTAKREGDDWGSASFPMKGTLADLLQEANPQLDTEEAYMYACLITEANDEGEIEAAWDALTEALAYIAPAGEKP